ncbi:hypothetical protein Bca52824_065281 [Brassica carinata]|uniref:Uncharacterized protein n=1 Tax=Brassica carinata TaxID=52824 RepID=A0A8X7UC96_BRACI|nr:hypothetical protein Bca52824_065281 [Brassica carinata]
MEMNSTLTRHKSKPRVYIGCMKSGPVLAQKGVEYHEPEYWKFSVQAGNLVQHLLTGAAAESAYLWIECSCGEGEGEIWHTSF